MMDLINPQTLPQTKQIGAITNTTVIAHVQRRGIFLKKIHLFLPSIRKCIKENGKMDLNRRVKFPDEEGTSFDCHLWGDSCLQKPTGL